uniref:TNF alpha induced protein 2 n=1 Tax=Suricata suricatta TaxID=37032 RepID=A0A673VDW6_SURSU
MHAHVSRSCLAPAPRTPGFKASRAGRELPPPPTVRAHSASPPPPQELMEAVHLHLVKEYIVRLSKRSLVLKTSEQQQQLAGHIQASADLIQRFCTQNGSPAAWLHHALPKLAEIIRLQDPSAIKIEVATYATWYPDFSKGHLSAILAIKGNLSSSEVKSIRSILDVSTGTHEPFKSLFSLIKVG